MAVTLSDVARAAGMSLPATSQILNGKGSYRAETQARVFTAARTLGYQPNVYAQAMARRSFGAYALVLSSNPSSSLMPRGLLEGFDAALTPQGLHLVLAFLPDNDLTDAGTVPKILSHVLADGLLINYNAGYPKAAVTLLADKGVPSVWLNVDHAHNAVHPDDHGAGRQMAASLLAHGHRRVAWFAPRLLPTQESMHYSDDARRDGFREVCPTADILGLPRGASDAEWATYARKILTGPNRPTAIGCYGVNELGVLIVAALRLGLEIPRDLSLITVHERAYSFGGIAFDTMIIDSAAQAHSAAAMLGRLIEKPGTLPSVAVPMTSLLDVSVTAPCR